jgi:DNA repair protein RadC
MAFEMEVVDGPRERAVREGLAEITDVDLVALVLGTGARGLPVTAVASTLVEVHGGVEGLSRTSASQLAPALGVGPAKALRLAACFELGRRAAASRLAARARLATSTEVAALMRPRLAHLDHEEMWLIALDGQNGLRAIRRIAQGGLHGCSVSARDILRSALVEAASAIVLVHNHPSRDPTPSAEDIAMTRIVQEAGDVVGVPIVDHVVVAGDRHASMLDLGLLG